MGIQVIMTTHNPSTVSFVDEKNLFLMYEENNLLKIKGGQEIGKHEIYNRLTSRLVSIDSPSRTLFVEGKDAKYYRLVYNYLKNQNNSLHFYQLSITPAPNKDLRNKDNLQKLINFLKASDDFDNNDRFNSIYALIDDDGDTKCENRIKLDNLIYLERYS
jgi:hypothetical protein